MTGEPHREQYEPAGIQTRGVLIAAGGFALLVVVALAVVWLLFEVAGAPRAPTADMAAPPPSAFPQPRLATDPTADLRRVRQREAARLHGYGWVDRERGLVRIPIERAMALIGARGADGYAPLAKGGEGRPGAAAPAPEEDAP